MSDELKLCPLCKDNRIEIEPYDNQGSLWCKGCGVLLTAKVFDAGMPDIEEKVKSSLAEIWNTRPIEDALRARIAELEEKQRWIPVSERLPEDLQSIIVFTKDRKTYIIRFLELYGREGFGSLSDIVTHWMPLPVLPESPNDTQSSTIVYGKEREE